MRKSVLVACDGGSGADGALRLALDLSRRRSTEVVVAGMLEPLGLHPLAGVWPRPEGYSLLEETRLADLSSAVSARVREIGYGCSEWRSVTEIGAAPLGIARQGHSIGARMILLGGGGSPLAECAEAERRETALRIAQLSSVPVVAVTPGTSSPPNRVLVAIDFGSASRRAAHAVLDLVGAEASVALVHAVPEETELEPLPSLRPWRERYEVAVLEELERLAALLRKRADIETECVVVRGDPREAVQRLADRLNVDLLAVGAAGPGASLPSPVGRTATRLVRGSRCSVLIEPAALAGGA